MPPKISSRSVVIVPVRPKILSILKDHLSLPLSLLLVFLVPLILINTIYEPSHNPDQFPGQRLSQIMLGGQANLECPYSYVIKVLIYPIEHLPIPVRISF